MIAEEVGFIGNLYKVGALSMSSHYTGSFHALLFLFVSLVLLSIVIVSIVE